MRRLARTVLLLLSLSPAVPAQPKTWHGTWGANVANSARVFSGTWDAVSSGDPNTVTGNWTLADQGGATLAAGAWSARKREKFWDGAWQARGSSGRIYSGTWSARPQLSPDMTFSELLESALAKTAGGTWRMGKGYWGGWSIRAYRER
jgi:hypothetical protein